MIPQAGWRAFVRYRAPMIKARTGRITARRFFSDLSGNLTACEGGRVTIPCSNSFSSAFQLVALRGYLGLASVQTSSPRLRRGIFALPKAIPAHPLSNGCAPSSPPLPRSSQSSPSYCGPLADRETREWQWKPITPLNLQNIRTCLHAASKSLRHLHTITRALISSAGRPQRLSIRPSTPRSRLVISEAQRCQVLYPLSPLPPPRPSVDRTPTAPSTTPRM